MLTLMLVQAVSGPVDPGSLPARCRRSADPNEVVVCGRVDQSRYRLERLPDTAPSRGPLPTAALKLKNGGSVAVEGQAGNVGPTLTNRAMVTLKLPF